MGENYRTEATGKYSEIMIDNGLFYYVGYKEPVSGVAILDVAFGMKGWLVVGEDGSYTISEDFVELDEPASSGGESGGGESAEGESAEGAPAEGGSEGAPAPEGESPEGEAPAESPEGESPEGEAPAAPPADSPEGESPEGESPEGESAGGPGLQEEEFEITVGDVTGIAHYQDLESDSEKRAFVITFDGKEYAGKIDKGVWTADDPEGADVIAAFQAAHEADPSFMGPPPAGN